MRNYINFIKKYKSERDFGIIFFIFFSMISLFPLLFEKNINLVFLCIGILFIFIGLTLPIVFYFPNKLWIRFGNFLGLITTPIILLLIYLITIVPISFIFKIIKFDNLKRIIDKDSKSYWIKREITNTDLNNQY